MYKLFFTIFFPTSLIGANFRPTVDELTDKEIDNKIQAITQESFGNFPAANLVRKEQIPSLNPTQLLANPKLLKRAMMSVLVSKNITAINKILPIYQQLPDKDPILVDYATALQLQSKGEIQSAIIFYRRLIAQKPELSAIRLDLAIALYANGQFTNAKEQLIRLKSKKLSKRLNKGIQGIINRIDKQEDWQFTSNFYFRNENNINNAPKQREKQTANGKLIFPKPEKAKGFHLSLGAKKRFNYENGYYSKLLFNLSSDYYLNNHQYDDLSIKTATDIGYQNNYVDIAFQPFIKQRFFSGKPYSLTYGVANKINYIATPKTKVGSYLEWSYTTHHDTRKHLNGSRYFGALSTTYLHSPQKIWSIGINYLKNNARDIEDSYQRVGIFASWGQEWQGGVSSNLFLSVGRKNYKGVDFFNIKRKDTEYSAKLMLWHRGLHYWGITPKLVTTWNKVDSNHFYYQKKEKQINLEFSKSF